MITIQFDSDCIFKEKRKKEKKNLKKNTWINVN